MQTVTLLALLINGHLVPALEFNTAFPDNCLFDHYHAAFGGKVTALDGTVIFDPDPDFCGYGPAGLIPVYRIRDNGGNDSDFDGVPDEAEAALGLDPNNPDSDDDGLLDGGEDFDEDGLSNAEEIHDFPTDPTNAKSFNPAVKDGVTMAIEANEVFYTLIPIYAKYLKGVTPSQIEDLRRNISNMNRLALFFMNMNFLLLEPPFVETQNLGDDGSDGGVAGDGMLTLGEFTTYLDFGLEELTAKTGGKGIGVGIVNPGGSLAGSGSPAISMRRVPFIFIEQRGDEDLTTSSLQAAIAHALGIRYKTVLDLDYGPENWMTPSTRRDAFTSSPEPFNGYGSIRMSLHQQSRIPQIGAGKYYGQTGRLGDKAIFKTDFQSGNASDAANDQAAGQPDHTDIQWGALRSESTDDFVSGFILTRASLPVTGTFSAGFQVAFDTDDNESTGSSVAGRPGMDKTLQLRFQRDEEGGEIRNWSRVVDAKDFGPGQPAEAASYKDSNYSLDIDAPRTKLYGTVEFRVSKQRLDLSAETVPGVIASEGTAPADSVDFVYETMPNLTDPQFQLDPPFFFAAGARAALEANAAAAPGDSLDFSLSGLTPNTDFTVTAADQVVVEDTTDGNGEYMGNVTVPAEASNSAVFLVALDEAGQYAWTVLPEPTAAVQALAALGLLAALARVRRSAIRE